MELSNTFVCLMGMGTVFIGLICIVFLCEIMSFFCRKAAKVPAVPAPVPASTAPIDQAIPNRQELIAAVSAVIAEDLGEDVSAIRILSIKKI